MFIYYYSKQNKLTFWLCVLGIFCYFQKCSDHYVISLVLFSCLIFFLYLFVLNFIICYCLCLCFVYFFCLFFFLKFDRKRKRSLFLANMCYCFVFSYKNPLQIQINWMMKRYVTYIGKTWCSKKRSTLSNSVPSLLYMYHRRKRMRRSCLSLEQIPP